MSAFEGSGGFILLIAYLVSGFLLVRVFRENKLPSWINKSKLNRECLLLAHMGLLIIAVTMIIESVVS